MVVIIIGILAAIAIPAFLAQRTRANNAAAESDLRNAAAAAQSCSADNTSGDYDGPPNNCHSLTVLTDDFGLNVSPGVTVTPTGSGPTTWSGTSVSSGGDTTYTYNSDDGVVTEQP